jgi:DNA polymerase
MNNAQWEELAKQINACQKCRLAESKKVLGGGNVPCDIVLVGESPGEKEVFEGKAGQLLTDILTIVGFLRKDVYFTNIIKCHPPNNETTADSALSCQSWLFQELEIIKPKIIMPMGTFATSFFIKDMTKISDVRGKWLQCGDYKVMPTFHPAYVLHGGGPMAKDYIISDFLKVRSELMGINNKVKAIKIKSKLLNDTILVGEGGVPLSELWLNLKQQ